MFSNMARDAFSTSPDGQRLFDLYGWPRRPFVVADAETEQRLLAKQWKYCQVFFPTLMISLVVFRDMYRRGVSELAAILFVAVVAAIGYVMRWLLFREAVRELPRASVRPRAAWRLKNIAANRRRNGLIASLFASLLFLALSVWWIVWQDMILFGAICGFFAIHCVASWSYTLWLQGVRPRQTLHPPPEA